MLKPGSRGPDVASWVEFLRGQGYDPGLPTDLFSDAVAEATRKFQADNGLVVDAIVGKGTYGRARDLGYHGDVDYVGARSIVPSPHFTPGRDFVVLDRVVLHTTEGPEGPHRADVTAGMFASEDASVSSQYITDPAGTVQCVRERDTAWHSGHRPTNKRSIGIEQNGRADQTPEQWDDENSRAELEEVAKLCADIVRRHPNIPVKRLTREEILADEPGFLGHKDVTDAYLGGKGHQDPGHFYPWEKLLARIRELLAAGSTTPPPADEIDTKVA